MKKWLTIGGLTLAACAAVALFQPEPAIALSGEAFQLTGAGSIRHYHGPPQPRGKTFVNKVKASGISSCISGNEASCFGLIEEDAGGAAYVFFDSPTSWRVASNPAGTDATTLAGFVGGRGEFVMSGTHALSDTLFVLTGKVKFAGKTLNVSRMSGRLTAVSSVHQHHGTFKVKTKGKALLSKR